MGVKKVRKRNGEIIYKTTRSSKSRSKSKSQLRFNDSGKPFISRNHASKTKFKTSLGSSVSPVKNLTPKLFGADSPDFKP